MSKSYDSVKAFIWILIDPMDYTMKALILVTAGDNSVTISVGILIKLHANKTIKILEDSRKIWVSGNICLSVQALPFEVFDLCHYWSEGFL